MTSRAWRCFCGLLALGLLALALPARTADAGGGAHPYFHDQGTLTWYHTYAEARMVAQREGKLIFVEFGRRVCTQCKLLCARVLPHPSIRGRMGRVAVGLVSECDRPEPAIAALFRRHLRGARMLPFVAFLTPDGRWVTGFAGSTTVSQFQGHLAAAERIQRRRGTRRPARPRPDPAPRPTPASPCAPRPTPPAPTPAVPTPCPLPGDDLLADAEACPEGQCRHTDPGCRAPASPPQPTPAAPAPSPRMPPSPTLADIGSPDAEEIAPPLAVALPPPAVRPRTAPPAKLGAPPAAPRPAPTVAATPPERTAVERAAAGGRWAEVLRHTRGAAAEDRVLRELNRRAHAWAHERLATAVRALRENRIVEARRAVTEVVRTMAGEPESVDARRGVEAIERIQDLQPLAAESPLRESLRKTAYERMRGTRWAPLFNDCPVSSRPLSQK